MYNVFESVVLWLLCWVYSMEHNRGAIYEMLSSFVCSHSASIYLTYFLPSIFLSYCCHLCTLGGLKEIMASLSWENYGLLFATPNTSTATSNNKTEQSERMETIMTKRRKNKAKCVLLGTYFLHRHISTRYILIIIKWLLETLCHLVLLISFTCNLISQHCIFPTV